jgi:hypothetical protein
VSLVVALVLPRAGAADPPLLAMSGLPADHPRLTAADPSWLCARCGAPAELIPDRPCPSCGCWWLVPRAQMVGPAGSAGLAQMQTISRNMQVQRIGDDPLRRT